MWGMMHTVSKGDFIRMTIKTLESYLSLAAEQAQKFDQAAAKVVCIMDMENFNIRQYAWRPGKYHIRIIYLRHSMKSLHITVKRIRSINTLPQQIEYINTFQSRIISDFCLN